MNKRLPPLNWLRSFESSARHLSFTHAANELNLTQAAISQQIKGLESQLGTILFNRLPRGLELTAAGAAYLPAVHESIERLRVATEEVFGQGRTSLLTIKVSLVFLINWLAPRLPSFRQKHPEINLKITSNIWVDNKESTDSDFEIRYGQGKWKALHANRLTWDELIPVCSPDYLKNNKQILTADDLTDHTLFHVLGYEEGWGHWLSQVNREHLKIKQGFQFDTLVTALELAVLGQGIALGRTCLVENMLASGKLVAPFEDRIAIEEAFYLVYANSHLTHPHAEIFKNWLLSEISKPK
ncbi:MAG: transcriptional regulator GcvA [Kangiellaceae bacterium]